MTKKIIIIEDDIKNLKLFIHILKNIPDVNILSETSGKTGLELIKSNKPDLIILDIQLPEITGIEICKELRKIDIYKSVPILAVTSFAMKGDEECIMDAGFDRYISKPIRVAEFREVVKSFLIHEKLK